jgi:hypothetical protein
MCVLISPHWGQLNWQKAVELCWIPDQVRDDWQKSRNNWQNNTGVTGKTTPE